MWPVGIETQEVHKHTDAGLLNTNRRQHMHGPAGLCRAKGGGGGGGGGAGGQAGLLTTRA